MHVHVDIVGPLPTIEEYSYLFMIIDRFTRWPEVAPYRTFLLKPVLLLFFLTGLLVSVLPRSLPVIAVANLLLTCGLKWLAS